MSLMTFSERTKWVRETHSGALLRLCVGMGVAKTDEVENGGARTCGRPRRTGLAAEAGGEGLSGTWRL